MDLRNVSISTGTLRPEDLIPTFIEAVRSFDERDTRWLGEIEKYIEDTPDYYESGDSDWDLEELFDTLNAIAPEGYYFGAHSGDGADFGFWEIEDYDTDSNI